MLSWASAIFFILTQIITKLLKYTEIMHMSLHLTYSFILLTNVIFFAF